MSNKSVMQLGLDPFCKPIEPTPPETIWSLPGLKTRSYELPFQRLACLPFRPYDSPAANVASVNDVLGRLSHEISSPSHPTNKIRPSWQTSLFLGVGLCCKSQGARQSPLIFLQFLTHFHIELGQVDGVIIGLVSPISQGGSVLHRAPFDGPLCAILCFW